MTFTVVRNFPTRIHNYDVEFFESAALEAVIDYILDRDESITDELKYQNHLNNDLFIDSLDVNVILSLITTNIDTMSYKLIKAPTGGFTEIENTIVSDLLHSTLVLID